MSDLVFFVSPTRVKRDTALQSSTDDQVIRPFIQIAQDRHIWPALGTQLYDRIKTDIKNSTLTGDYETLVEQYIQPCLSQMVFCEMAYIIRLRFSNNSVTVANSEVGGSASIQDIKLVKEQAESIGMFYRERMIDYLCHNQSLFREYVENTGADLQPSNRNYFQSLNLYPRTPYSNQAKAYLEAIGVRNIN